MTSHILLFQYIPYTSLRVLFPTPKTNSFILSLLQSISGSLHLHIKPSVFNRLSRPLLHHQLHPSTIMCSTQLPEYSIPCFSRGFSSTCSFSLRCPFLHLFWLNSCQTPILPSKPTLNATFLKDISVIPSRHQNALGLYPSPFPKLLCVYPLSPAPPSHIQNSLRVAE